nr:hypothetical protein GCM10020241_08030 [Streptoalloteichus tenebrarius]
MSARFSNRTGNGSTPGSAARAVRWSARVRTQPRSPTAHTVGFHLTARPSSVLKAGVAGLVRSCGVARAHGDRRARQIDPLLPAFDAKGLPPVRHRMTNKMADHGEDGCGVTCRNAEANPGRGDDNQF